MIDSNIKLGKGVLCIKGEDGELKELQPVENIEYIGIDYANEEDKTGVFLSNGEISISLEYITKKKYHRKRKGKRYIYSYYEETTLHDDFLEKVFGVKNKNRKISKIKSK